MKLSHNISSCTSYPKHSSSRYLLIPPDVAPAFFIVYAKISWRMLTREKQVLKEKSFIISENVCFRTFCVLLCLCIMLFFSYYVISALFLPWYTHFLNLVHLGYHFSLFASPFILCYVNLGFEWAGHLQNSTLQDELQEQETILRQCIEQLESSESK